MCQLNWLIIPTALDLKGLDSFPGQSSDKGKSVMGDNNEEINLTDIVVAQPTTTHQNELIMQSMQQITEMIVEMQRRHDLPPPDFTDNSLTDGRSLLYFPSSYIEQAQNAPSAPAQNPPVIDFYTKCSV